MFDSPIPIQFQFAALVVWSRAKVAVNPKIGRQDLPAIRGHQYMEESDWVNHWQSPWPWVNLSLSPTSWFSNLYAYDHTDFLQAPQNIVRCCPATLESNSTALLYVLLCISWNWNKQHNSITLWTGWNFVKTSHERHWGSARYTPDDYSCV